MAQRGGTPAIVRPAWNDPVLIKQVLDLGAEGILVPMVNSGPEAERAVQAAKYPPQGRRGWGPNAAAEFGLRTEAYAEEANDRIAVLVQIEHIDAVRNLDDILAVPGVDGVYVGPGDLSYSMGIPREWDNPLLIAAIREVMQKARAAGVPAGGDASGPLDNVLNWAGYGAQFMTVGADTSFMREGAEAMLASLRAALLPPA
jgi:2-keto-3-deoxy-L-rhamnonate aldolase RhmA